MIFLTTLLFSVFITIALIPIFTKISQRINLVDIPDHGRKVHERPMPKSGGIAMAIGALVPVLIWLSEETFVRWYIAGLFVILVSALIDDIKGHGPWTKFFAQIVAALIIVLPGSLKIQNLGMLLPEGFILPQWISIPLTIVAIVGVTNAINLADGLDGLAGGICLLSFSCLGYIAYLSDNNTIALLSVAMAGAIFGFLRFNTYPASIFMGDTGSQFLGFSAIVLSLKLTQEAPVLSPILPLIILGFPVLDTIAVMTQRYQEGRPLFRADRNHFHHRLMRLGFYQNESVLIIYLIQAGLVTAALLLRFHSEWLLLGIYLIFSTIVIGTFILADRRGLRIRQFNILDRILKERLKELKEKGHIIRISFRIIEFGLPLLLLLSSFIPARIPIYASYAGIGAIVILIMVWNLWRRHLGFVLRGALYFFIPYVIYLGDVEKVSWMEGRLLNCYNFAFFVFAVFIVVTMKFSRRREGFKSTPMDFLILFVALVVPNLPIEEIKSYHLGLIAAKIITLFFSYEVLMGELRGNFGRLTLFTISSIAVFTAKGII